MTAVVAPDPAGPFRLEMICGSLEQTRALGRCLGTLIRTKLVIALIGELGAGKTAFVQGLAKGLGVTDPYVTSPTFSLINAYQGRIPLYHADLYRLGDDPDLCELGLDEILAADSGVVAMEWAERLNLETIGARLEACFAVIADDSRRIDLRAYGQAASDLLRRLKQQF